jgi:hypothetical protein
MKKLIILALLSLLVSVNAFTQKSFLIDFQGNTGADSPATPTPGNWNNFTQTAPYQKNWGLSGLVATDGTISNYGFNVGDTNVFSDGYITAQTPSASPIFPETATGDFMAIYQGEAPAEVQITGLDNAKYYTFTMFGSRALPGASRIVVYTIIGATKDSASLEVRGNTSNNAVVTGIMPSNGKIIFRMNCWASHALINAMKIVENSTYTATRNIFADKGALSVYPNPVSSELNIDYSLKNRSKSKISIYDAKGTLIFEDNNPDNKAGNYSYKWNRTNNAHARVSAGTYILKVNADGKEVTKTIILK